MAKRKFIRSKWRTYSKLGSGRPKLQRYRKARGRHSKVREHMKGNLIKVEIGFKKQENKLVLPIIRNASDLDKMKKGESAMVANIGQKKKLDMIKKAEEKGIMLVNLNKKKLFRKMERAKKFRQLAKSDEEKKKKKDEKTKKEKKQEGEAKDENIGEKKDETG